MHNEGFRLTNGIVVSWEIVDSFRNCTRENVFELSFYSSFNEWISRLKVQQKLSDEAVERDIFLVVQLQLYQVYFSRFNRQAWHWCVLLNGDGTRTIHDIELEKVSNDVSLWVIDIIYENIDVCSSFYYPFISLYKQYVGKIWMLCTVKVPFEVRSIVFKYFTERRFNIGQVVNIFWKRNSEIYIFRQIF